jgi:hypothetical protein
VLAAACDGQPIATQPAPTTAANSPPLSNENLRNAAIPLRPHRFNLRRIAGAAQAYTGGASRATHPSRDQARLDYGAVVPEATLKPADGGFVPDGEGWFVLNARDARWLEGDFGAYTRFEGEPRFPQLGFNIGVLEPGQPACM